jgi:hypothetical protein
VAKQAVALRLAPEVLEWADEYAAGGACRGRWCWRSAVASFMEDCKAGVPQLRAAARAQSSVARGEGAAVGECPKNKAGHVFVTVDGVRACEFCRLPGRAHLAEFGAARAEFFSRLKPPMTSGTGKAPGGGSK